MPEPSLSAEQVLTWVDRTALGWRDLIAQHPQILALPCDIMDVATVGGLLQHIVAAQLRYAERLIGLPITEYPDIPFHSADAIYSVHQRSAALFRALLAGGLDWNERIEFATRAGQALSSRRTILFHALFHSIRHYAQLATLVRQHGIAPGWPMDYLFMDLERIQPNRGTH
ncbi:MAG: hypothetical protein NVSMB62_23020 [Acidobacteriaceae bacterium]